MNWFNFRADFGVTGWSVSWRRLNGDLIIIPTHLRALHTYPSFSGGGGVGFLTWDVGLTYILVAAQ